MKRGLKVKGGLKGGFKGGLGVELKVQVSAGELHMEGLGLGRAGTITRPVSFLEASARFKV